MASGNIHITFTSNPCEHRFIQPFQGADGEIGKKCMNCAKVLSGKQTGPDLTVHETFGEALPPTYGYDLRIESLCDFIEAKAGRK